MPATISEVVGNDGEDMDLASLTKNFSDNVIKDTKQKSLVGELWSGIVDDVLGRKGPKAAH